MRCLLDMQGAQNESRFRGIGRYCFSLARAMAQQVGKHELWLTLNASFPEQVERIRSAFDGVIPQDRVVAYRVPAPCAEVGLGNDWRARAAEKVRESFLEELNPDIVYVLSLFDGWCDDSVTSIGSFARNLPTAAVLYDLIPLLRPKEYLPDARRKAWYDRKLQSLQSAQLLTAISDSSRQEAVQRANIPEDRIAVIGCGVDPQFRPIDLIASQRLELRHRYGIAGEFIMYSGGVDARKNVEGLITALALLPAKLRQSHQLVIAGAHNSGERELLLNRVQVTGLPRNSVVFTGYVPDEDLIALYNQCALFVLPSFHEGFGLPAAEAMACGAPTIGADATSIPEVIGREDALFDPQRPRAIAGKIEEVLTNDALRRQLREHGLLQCKRFSWENSARAAWRALEELHEGRSEQSSERQSSTFSATNSRRLLAYFSPLAPIPGGITNYSAELLPELARYYEIEIIAFQPEVTDQWVKSNCAVRNLSYFEANASRYSRILYHVGNSPFHAHMWRMMERYPGTVVLHDFYQSSVLNWVEREVGVPGAFGRALYRSHGYSGVLRDLLEGREAAMRAFPCNRHILDAAAGVIVHSQHSIALAEQWYGPRLVSECAFVPHLGAAELPDRTCALICSRHAPSGIAEQYWRAIECFAQTHRRAREEGLLREIGSVASAFMPDQTDLFKTASAVANNRVFCGPRQLLLDVSETAKHDAKTGIQRVTRAITLESILGPPTGFRIEPVRSIEGQYCYARNFTLKMLGSDIEISESPVEVHPGDTYLALDLCAEAISSSREFFDGLRARGIRICFMVYDLLPLLLPHRFPPEIEQIYQSWLEGIVAVADKLIAISRATADELFAWLDTNRPERLRPLQICYSHLGADIQATAPSKGLPAESENILGAMTARPTFLMVGTMEPRKGYSQVLAAFSQLWAAGVNANLVIVGKQGWMMERLAQQIQQHREFGHRLFWLIGISDEMLQRTYENSTALIAASEGEGFGLPLIEAARAKLPIIARDLPVFREVAGDHAFYFNGDTPEALSSALRKWLDLLAENAVPRSEHLRWMDWKQSALRLTNIVLGDECYREWPAAERQSGGRSPVGRHTRR